MSITSMISRNCNQTAVYWGNPVNDGTGGYTFDDPYEVMCRWDDEAVLFKDEKGNEIMSKAVVVIPQAYPIENEGWLYLGTLEDSVMDSDTIPEDLLDAYQIKKINKNSVLGLTTKFMIEVYLG